jgi:hypothetical protein
MLSCSLHLVEGYEFSEWKSSEKNCQNELKTFSKMRDKGNGVHLSRLSWRNPGTIWLESFFLPFAKGQDIQSPCLPFDKVEYVPVLKP